MLSLVPYQNILKVQELSLCFLRMILTVAIGYLCGHCDSCERTYHVWTMCISHHDLCIFTWEKTLIRAVRFGILTQSILCSCPSGLLCLSNHMQASVSRSYLQSMGYSASDLGIPGWNSSYRCRPQITQRQITFTIPYTGCGTTKQVSLAPPTLLRMLSFFKNLLCVCI